MVRLGRRLAVGFAFCMSTVTPVTAGIGFQPVSPDELKMTSEPLAPGAPAIVLYRQVDRDDNLQTPQEDNYVRIKILTEEGRKHANVEIPFVKGLDKIVNVKARTIKPDGSIAEFGGQIFEKELVKARGTKILAKTFTLPDVEVGCILEYFFTIDFSEHRLFDSHWILSNELYTKKALFSLKPFHGGGRYLPYYVRWSWSNLPPGTEPPKEEKSGIIRMEAKEITAFPIEDYMPPTNELKARVDFIYEQNSAASVAKDQAAYWREFGKKRDNQLESYAGKRKAMEEAVSQIISPNDVPEVKLRKIYERVQRIRNTSYEMRKTEEELKREKEKPAENVEEVWKGGYGNGVELTWLFLGLVRAAGFEAYGCWVSARNEYFFSPVTMQGSKLNANVVLVKLNGKDVYFDPGGAFTPFGLLTWSETGVAGLKLDKDGGSWIQTTLPQPSESRIERVGKLKLSDTGDLEGKLTITYTGLEAMYHRLEERHADDVERKKYLEERVTSQVGGPAEAELTNKPDWTTSQTPLVAELTVKIPGWASNAGSRAIIPAAVFTAGEKGLFEHVNRVHPIYFDYPHEKSDDITVELPPGWQIGSLPTPQDQDQHVVHYAMKVESVPGALRLTRNLSIDITLLGQKYYSALRNFFQMVRTSDAEQIVLLRGQIHASN